MAFRSFGRLMCSMPSSTYSINVHRTRFMKLALIKSCNSFTRNVTTTSNLLSERRFSDKHEWASRDGNTVKVGVSQYAQEALGDVVFVQLPDVGTEVSKDDEVGAVESVKAASEVYTPLTGKVVEINNILEDKPGLVNSSCYEEGWLFKVEIFNENEYKELMTEDQYADFVKKAKE